MNLKVMTRELVNTKTRWRDYEETKYIHHDRHGILNGIWAGRPVAALCLCPRDVWDFDIREPTRSALMDMQKNVDDLQKNMGTVKQIKDQLTSLSPQGGGVLGGDKLKKDSDTLKEMVPKF